MMKLNQNLCKIICILNKKYYTFFACFVCVFVSLFPPDQQMIFDNFPILIQKWFKSGLTSTLQCKWWEYDHTNIKSRKKKEITLNQRKLQVHYCYATEMKIEREIWKLFASNTHTIPYPLSSYQVLCWNQNENDISKNMNIERNSEHIIYNIQQQQHQIFELKWPSHKIKSK